MDIASAAVTPDMKAQRIEAAAQKMYRAYREFGELHALMPEWAGCERAAARRVPGDGALGAGGVRC